MADGVTDVSGLPIIARPVLAAGRCARRCAEADLVIAHAGVGSALTALDQGRAPVLLPRLKEYGEMVDDHQLMIAAELQSRGPRHQPFPDELTVDDLRTAMTFGVEAASVLPPFELDG